MRRQTLLRGCGLLVAATLFACTAFRAQHAGRRAAPAPAPAEESPAAAFTELGTDRQLARVRGEVSAAQRNLAQAGHYSCCVEPACNECLLKRGECHCRDLVRQSGPCGECTEAWIEGRGVVAGVNARDLLERKKKLLDAPQQEHP
jgi:hypothetical protein